MSLTRGMNGVTVPIVTLGTYRPEDSGALVVQRLFETLAIVNMKRLWKAIIHPNCMSVFPACKNSN